MSTIEDIEMAVTRLAPSDYEKFRQWLSDFDNRKWDAKLDEDSRSGRLDALAKEALEELERGQCSDL